MKLKEFLESAQRTYEQGGYKQCRKGWLRRTKGRVVYVCPMTAALIDVGFPVNDFTNKDHNKFYAALEEHFGLKYPETSNIVLWNDYLKYDWLHILNLVEETFHET